jgi:hypothetical protein
LALRCRLWLPATQEAPEQISERIAPLLLRRRSGSSTQEGAEQSAEHVVHAAALRRLLRAWLGHAAAHHRAQEATKDIVHAAGAGIAAATALGRAGLPAALDGDHAGTLSPALQHFGKLLALIVREILHGCDGGSLQDFRGDLASHALQVVHGFFGAETFSGITRGVAVHEVVFVVGEFAQSLSLGPALSAPRFTVIGSSRIFSLATSEQSLELVRHGSRSFTEQLASPRWLSFLPVSATPQVSYPRVQVFISS